MKIFILSLLGTFLSLTFSHAQNKSGGKGEVITQERDISPFQTLKVNGVFNVYLKQGTKDELKIEGKESTLEHINSRVSNGKLIIDSDKNCKVKNYSKLNVYVTFKNIEEIDIDIVGNVFSENAIDAKNLVLNFNGVGNSELSFNCDQIDAQLARIGNMDFDGNVNEMELSSKCTGNLDARDLHTNHLHLTNSSIGNVRVHANETIDIKSSGVGNVSYSGKAVVTNLDASGIGKIRKI